MTIRRLVKKILPQAVIEARNQISERRNASARRIELERAEQERIARRRAFATRYYEKKIARIEQWARDRSEESNFLYDITEKSRSDLAHLLATMFDTKTALFRDYFHEIDQDEVFRTHIVTNLREHLPDARSIHIGRRLGWYAVARHIKPKLIIETGVDFGLGACVLSAALLRNAAEGCPGNYIGTELRTEAGQIYTAPYNSVGQIAYGDSISTLKRMNAPLTGVRQEIDLFVNDSDHSIDYEASEYEAITPILSNRAVVLGDNSHYSPALADFSERHGRRFAFYQEEPKDHWYPGAGIGISIP